MTVKAPAKEAAVFDQGFEGSAVWRHDRGHVDSAGGYRSAAKEPNPILSAIFPLKTAVKASAKEAAVFDQGFEESIASSDKAAGVEDEKNPEAKAVKAERNAESNGLSAILSAIIFSIRFPFVFSLFVVITLFFRIAIAQAEIIQLKNGNAMETKILKEDERFVTVQAPGGKVKIPKKDIEKIWSGSSADLLAVQNSQVLFDKGIKLYQQGRFAEAAENFEQALRPGVRTDILYANLGSAYASIGAAKKAEKNFLQALQLKPEDPAVLLNLAHFYESQKNFSSAIRFYEKYLSISPQDLNAQRSMAYCQYMIGNYEKAAQIFEELGKKNDVVALCNSAAAYIQARQLEKASQILSQLLASPLPVPRAHFLMAEVFRMQNYYSGAEEHYQKALKQDPDVTKVNTGLALLYLDMKEWDKAETLLNEALDKEPTSPVALHAMVRLANQKKEYEKANDALNRLLNQDPKNVALLNEQGLLFLKRHRPKEALSVYRKIFKRNDNYALGHANAGLAYVFLGDADKALEEWDRALALDPELKVAAQNKKILEEILQKGGHEAEAGQ